MKYSYTKKAELDGIAAEGEVYTDQRLEYLLVHEYVTAAAEDATIRTPAADGKLRKGKK